MYACRERKTSNIRISCRLNLVVTHYIVKLQSPVRQKVGIRHFPKMVFKCCFVITVLSNYIFDHTKLPFRSFSFCQIGKILFVCIAFLFIYLLSGKGLPKP